MQDPESITLAAYQSLTPIHSLVQLWCRSLRRVRVRVVAGGVPRPTGFPVVVSGAARVLIAKVLVLRLVGGA